VFGRVTLCGRECWSVQSETPLFVAREYMLLEAREYMFLVATYLQHNATKVLLLLLRGCPNYKSFLVFISKLILRSQRERGMVPSLFSRNFNSIFNFKMMAGEYLPSCIYYYFFSSKRRREEKRSI
jgi:hypothetical protein